LYDFLSIYSQGSARGNNVDAITENALIGASIRVIVRSPIPTKDPYIVGRSRGEKKGHTAHVRLKPRCCEAVEPRWLRRHVDG